MGGYLSANEARAQSKSAMPTPLGEIHHELHEEVSWLHLKWNQFRALYASTDETIDLLNATAPTFFKNQCRIMWEDALLHLCRVTDRPKSCGKPTLTIMRIPTLIPDANIRTQVQLLANIADQKCEFARMA